MSDPSRWESEESQHFAEAYRKRPFTNLAVTALWLAVLSFLGYGVFSLFKARFLAALLSLGGAFVCFFLWYVIHNWALTHPK